MSVIEREVVTDNEVKHLLSALTALKKGDSAVRLPLEWTGLSGKLAETFNDVVELNENMAQELARLRQAVGKQGKLKERASLGEVKGFWKESIVSVNALIDDLVHPTSETARVIGAVAQGDLSQTMALEVDDRALEGEFLRTAKTINKMVDQLGSFASEVTRVARDKTHGVLALALVPSDRHFGSAELDLAADIASRVAVAMDNCLLFQEIQKGDQRKSEFLATLSHELRNPLAPMRNAIHALHLSGQWPAGAQELREMFDRQLGQLTHLVNDLLDVARISQGKIQLRTERTDLVAEINDALKSCHSAMETAGHQLVVALPHEPVMVEGDRVRLQQIFENLLFNACKYTDPNGRINVSLTSGADEAVFTIRDSGVGIAPEMIPKIWDIFAQVDASPERTRQGLGIGLSLVKKLVALHGGSIEANSEGLGKGSEFVVRFTLVAAGMPQAATPAASAEVQAPELAVCAQARRILVIDDNVDAAESLQVLLGVFGHRVEIAHEGVTALQVVWTFKPDLVFLDIGLPGMNGYEVARRIRDEIGMKSVRLIALSGYGAESDQTRSREAGFVRHLVKPVDPSALPNIISEVFAD